MVSLGDAETPSEHFAENDNSKFANPVYWERRYASEGGISYDWLGDYGEFQEFMRAKVLSTDRILMLGCGSSELSRQMYEDGCKQIVNSDISAVCIEQQKQLHRNCPGLEWKVLDMMHMDDIENGSFDVVIEKATLDAFSSIDTSVWRVSWEQFNAFDKTLSEVSRVLKNDGGRFISLTFAQPRFRLPMLAKRKFNWDVTYNEYGSTFPYHFFVMTKGRKMGVEVFAKSLEFLEGIDIEDEVPSGVA